MTQTHMFFSVRFGKYLTILNSRDIQLSPSKPMSPPFAKLGELSPLGSQSSPMPPGQVVLWSGFTTRGFFSVDDVVLFQAENACSFKIQRLKISDYSLNFTDRSTKLRKLIPLMSTKSDWTIPIGDCRLLSATTSQKTRVWLGGEQQSSLEFKSMRYLYCL